MACAGKYLTQLAGAGCTDKDIKEYCTIAGPPPPPTKPAEPCVWKNYLMRARNRSCITGAAWCPGSSGCRCPTTDQFLLNSINATHVQVTSPSGTIDDVVVSIKRGIAHSYDWCVEKGYGSECRNDNATTDFTGGDGTATEYGALGFIGFGDGDEGGDGCNRIYWQPRGPHNGTYPPIFLPGPKKECPKDHTGHCLPGTKGCQRWAPLHEANARGLCEGDWVWDHIPQATPCDTYKTQSACPARCAWAAEKKACESKPKPPPGPPPPPRPGAPVKVTPAVIRATYQVSGQAQAGHGSQGVVEFTPSQGMHPADLTAFFKQYVPDAKPGEDAVLAFKGDLGSDPEGAAGVEAALDIEYIMGVAQLPSPEGRAGPKTEFWHYTEKGVCMGFKLWATALLASDNVPLVNSASYGWRNSLIAFGCTTEQIADVESSFQRLKGISLLVASGDYGSNCQKDPESPGGGEVCRPNWPASSAWCTAVGSTRFINQDTSAGEQATDQFGSGGGFSTYGNDMPDYQTADVEKYLSAAKTNGTLPPASAFNASGRATPDVAALGEGFQVIVDGRLKAVGGTSASAPTFAAIISLLNAHRLAAGQKPMGFLNPWLYKHPQVLTDIVVGTNGAFNCAVGWDPVTGLGTPVFPKMLKQALIDGKRS
jgi:hypothetical protein